MMRDTFVILIIGAASMMMGFYSPPTPAQCQCDLDAQNVRHRLALAWGKAFEGEPLGDEDLQAFSEADQILKCVSGR